MSGENGNAQWSFDQWQCGMGVIDQCRDVTMDWDKPRTWQALVDQLIPLTEIGIVFGFQYIASEIGPGVTRALNSLRCMFNNWGSNTWQFGAATWLLLKYAGVTEDPTVVADMDSAYQYVCTCIYDVNGIKGMLGLSAESSSEFSSCSEAAADEATAGNKRSDEKKAERQQAARQSVVDAARQKMIDETVDKIKGLDGCNIKDSSTFYDTQCWTGVSQARLNADATVLYWENQVLSSGGVEGTKNRNEQTNLGNAIWVQTGSANAAYELYPERFNEDGSFVQTCSNDGETVYGSACEQIREDYKTNNAPNFETQALAEEAISCTMENGDVRTTVDDCDLVELEYGLLQWQDASQIDCVNPADLQNYKGVDNCVNQGGFWKYRAEYINRDQPQFRTLGDQPVTQVAEKDISCLADDFKTIRQGSDDCWAHWISGVAVEIGVDIQTENPIRQDMYVWLSNESVICGVDINGQPVTGIENCKIESEIDCNSNKILRLGVGEGSSICVPSFTWESRD